MSEEGSSKEEHGTRLGPVEIPVHPALVTQRVRALKAKKIRISVPRRTGGHSLADAWIAANIPNLEIRQIEAVAIDVLGSVELGRRWLEQPNLATYNVAPISLLGSEGGYEHVHQLLMRIEYGNLA